MKIDIQSIHFDADAKLLDYINKKVTKLSTFHHGIKGADVYLKLQKSTEKENKVVEIKVNVPNGPLFAEQHSVTFEAATDLAVDQLKIQVKRHSEKMKEK
jgi:putative sigma-54 modulation protein